MVFPHEPLVRVRGPGAAVPAARDALLDLVNFQTLIATKAARVCLAAQGRAGAGVRAAPRPGHRRRALGRRAPPTSAAAPPPPTCWPASSSASRSRAPTPTSWVMLFDDETRGLHGVRPGACPPTASSWSTPTTRWTGVRHAVEVGRWLREQGHELVGIRLDSGDLAWLSHRGARDLLDEAGFPDAAILASNDLDEHSSTASRTRGRRISVWGVGTRLVTGLGRAGAGRRLQALGRARRPGEALGSTG